MSLDKANQHCRYEVMAAAAALHALEPDEETEFAKHLSTCPRCQRVLSASKETAAMLSAAVPQEEPPPELRARVFDLAARTPQTAASGGSRATHLRNQPEVIPLRTRRLPKILTAAAAVLLIAAVVGLGVRIAQLSSQRDAQAAQTAQFDGALHQLGDPSTQMALLRDDDKRMVAMVIAGRRQTSVLLIQLRPTGPDQTYVLWGTSSAKPEALATFSVSAGDIAERLATLAAGHTHMAFAVSIEPGHTAPSTPTKVVASGSTTA